MSNLAQMGMWGLTRMLARTSLGGQVLASVMERQRISGPDAAQEARGLDAGSQRAMLQRPELGVVVDRRA